MKRFGFILILAFCFRALAAEVIPPAPTKYFNDYAGVVSPATAEQLNRTLENFERESSDQILVAVFPKMQSDSSIEDYTVRVARAWRAGQKEKNNGAILFVFIQDRSMFIQVGYGLEGALTDALSKRIIEEQIVPRFRAGDIDGGLTAGVQSILAGVKGEYQGTGRTVADRRKPSGGVAPFLFFGIMLVIILLNLGQRRNRYRGGWTIGGGGFGGGGWGGGGGFSGAGGGFSGGGGSFGGGGAGGRW
ncbi:MAG: TPM domain-containing protein [Verrucomicrobiota bacterium]